MRQRDCRNRYSRLPTRLRDLRFELRTVRAPAAPTLDCSIHSVLVSTTNIGGHHGRACAPGAQDAAARRLRYTSPNAPALADVLGTWMLSILDGHCRYAHVGALRGDGVAPSILGMTRIIGDDSLRRALAAIAPAPDAKHTAGQRAATAT